MSGPPPAWLRSGTDDDGRFINPWLPGAGERSFRDVARWQLQRIRTGVPPNPGSGAFPTAVPDPARPRAAADELRITWIGHTTFLIQYGGLNLLTDPVWSERASPFRRVGPKRLTRPGLPLDLLPPVDVVMLSHDHYDHLDAPTVRGLNDRFGSRLQWVTPTGYARWFHRRGVRRVIELDWWDEVHLAAGTGTLSVRALPAQHWTRRMTSSPRRRLWAAFMLTAAGAAPVFFGGDSGYFAGYRDIGRICGPFAAALLPIGAYEPRWFMRDAHMNPEEAVQAWMDLGAMGTLVAGHWGTFRLTDEPPLEPPVRLRAAWRDAGLPDGQLWIPAVGETRSIALLG